MRIIFFFFQAEDGIRDLIVTGVQTCALPISAPPDRAVARGGQPPATARSGGAVRRRDGGAVGARDSRLTPRGGAARRSRGPAATATLRRGIPPSGAAPELARSLARRPSRVPPPPGAGRKPR